MSRIVGISAATIERCQISKYDTNKQHYEVISPEYLKYFIRLPKGITPEVSLSMKVFDHIVEFVRPGESYNTYADVMRKAVRKKGGWDVMIKKPEINTFWNFVQSEHDRRSDEVRRSLSGHALKALENYFTLRTIKEGSSCAIRQPSQSSH
jgi:hypothetical protein